MFRRRWKINTGLSSSTSPLASQLRKAKVAETIVVKPLGIGIEEAMDAEIAKHKQGRCFIQPSGTEDVVRVYTEARTQESADSLPNSVAKLVGQILGSAGS